MPGVFAAGDICEYDSVVHGGAPMRIEHWDVAFNHGKTAALNMLGSDVPHEEVPYFYSVLADWGELEYVGPAYEWDEEIVRGSIDEGGLHQLVPEGRGREGRAHVSGAPTTSTTRGACSPAKPCWTRPSGAALGDLETDLDRVAR